MLIFANLLGSLITNPIDVSLAKILTQNEKHATQAKYRGLIRTLLLVYKEEGASKFLSGLHPRFMFNMLNGFVFLFVYDRFSHYLSSIYE